MAKIQLSTAVTVQIERDGEVAETFNVTYKELSKSQQREATKRLKNVTDIFKKNESLSFDIDSLRTNLKALQNMGDDEAVIKTNAKITKIRGEIKKLEMKYEELGGDDIPIAITKNTFDLCVGGADKEALTKFIEESSDYKTVLAAIVGDAKEQMGKQG